MPVVDLKIDSIPGFYKFLSSWIHISRHGLVIIDSGPSSTIEQLISAIKPFGEVKYILLTHIHSDHAGGLSKLLNYYPNAKVVVHQRSHEHIENPKKLIESSKKALGSLFLKFGSIKPIEKNKLIKPEESPFDFVYTPGHSADHTCFIIDNILYSGEALGVIYPFESSETLYLRPASPKRFFYDSYIESIRSLKSIQGFKEIRFAHFGKINQNLINKIFDISLDQINFWKTLIKNNLNSDNQEIFMLLINKDPQLKLYNKLPKDIQNRESIYISNSIKGLKYYLSSQ